ncbi:SusC/RagA family TonB-linked outer membrane protein [Cyclobacterium qasimii]|uniref:SusC/RagA family TonB-linked outer membrane protein n=2 Tax=Cyclobacterium qasimii TaxID=1350429 RepID=A0A512CHM6_9BACT|nr:TonB-dependent receptor [Cyclobacterium qasimii]GEO23723.1 SusC/RagA family TonB-linked outer membrane protein [Cyclobacterium qasimii]
MRSNIFIVLVMLLVSPLLGLAQNITISGKVISDEDGMGIPGVSIGIKESGKSTVTDISGRYQLTLDSKETIICSYLGFIQQEILVKNKREINIRLVPNLNTLDEIVVVGYGSINKSDLTGNVSKIEGEEIANIPVPNFQETLQGRLAGVFVASSSGKLGDGVKIRIRGTTSISAGNDPLYIIDGIPVTTAGSIDNSNPMSMINMGDIASINVLKDAAAASIYGARGSNGVVVITTKKGSSGKTKFNVGIQRGISSPTRKMDFLNASQYVELFREAGYNNDLAANKDPLNNPLDYPDSDLQYVENRLDQYAGHSDWRDGAINTNWQDQAFNGGAGVTNVNFSASGGDEKTRFYLSSAYDKQDGILIRNDFERISGRLNFDHNVSEKFRFGANFSLTRTVTNSLPSDNQFNSPMQLVALAPISPIRDLNGELTDRPTTTYYNNLIDSENSSWTTTSLRNINSIYGELNVAKNLTFRSEFGLDNLVQNDDRYFGSRTATGQSSNGYGSSRWLKIATYNTNNFFTYQPFLQGPHKLEATLGMSFQKSENRFTSVDGQEFPLDGLTTLKSAAEIVDGLSTLTNASFLSYFTRVNYKLDGKYLLGLSARYDGSSRFGKSEKYGFFPAGSLGWLVSEEDFLKDNSYLSYFKVRTSFGITGNALIGDFDHMGLYEPLPYGLSPGLSPTQIANPNLTWETTQQFDFGLEFGFFEDRFTGEVDFYNKMTRDLLLLVPVPATTGFATQRQNIGKMQNYGIEVLLNSINYSNSNLVWKSSFNFARNINRVRALSKDQSAIPPPYSSYLNGIYVDQPMAVFFGPKYAGVDPANGDALYFKDEAQTETTSDYNTAARLFLGSPNPDFIGGLTNEISYKNLDLVFLLQGVYGNKIYEAAGGYYANNANWFDNNTVAQMERWQEPGDLTDVPQARLGYCNGCSASSRYISDGSYLRLKTISLAYNFPEEWNEKLKINNAKIYIIAQNMLTFTKYHGWDPEVGTEALSNSFSNANLFQGVDLYSAPQAKTYSIGLNLGF